MVYAEEIEGAVLGACLLERSAQAVVLKSLRAEMFYLTAHRVVFEAINALYARGAAVDMLTVTEELRALGRLDDAGGPFAVAKLAAGVATSAHLEYHCGILFQYYLRRKLVEALTRELAASELFGYEKGRIYRSHNRKEGSAWSEADGGTLVSGRGGQPCVRNPTDVTPCHTREAVSPDR